MLTIGNPIKSVRDAVAYFFAAVTGYFLDPSERRGKWIGGAAEKLGLLGLITEKVFENLLRGFSPDGTEKLVQNAGKDNRQAGWDLVFSAVKSYSFLWGMSDSAGRKVLEALHEKNVLKAFGYIEENAGFTRRGHGGTSLEPALMLGAHHFHTTSRAGDMQIHSHVTVPNVCVRSSDGKTASLWTRRLFDLKMEAGAVYQKWMAEDIENKLGLTLEPEGFSYRIKEVPKELCEVFSKRGNEVKSILEERGLSGQVAAKLIALETRAEKQHFDLAKLTPEWHTVAEAFGWGPTQARQLLEAGREKLSAKAPALELGAQPPPPSVSISHEVKIEPSPSDSGTSISAVQKASPNERAVVGMEPAHFPVEWKEAPYNASGAAELNAGKKASVEKRVGSPSLPIAILDDQSRSKSKRHDNGNRESARSSTSAEWDYFSQGPGEDNLRSSRSSAGKEGGARAAHAEGHSQKPKSEHSPFFRVEQRPIAPNAPFWSPFKNLTLPVITMKQQGDDRRHHLTDARGVGPIAAPTGHATRSSCHHHVGRRGNRARVVWQ